MNSNFPEHSPVEATVHRNKARVSNVWLIPLIAAAIGVWLVWQHIQSRGQIVEIRFETAEGVSSRKTKILCRSVEIGIVESVSLTKDLGGVRVFARVDQEHRRLLRKDSRFWVVRPRIGGSGISGLGTIVSGTHIELDPGSDKALTDKFQGLEDPPITAQGTPGVRLTLISKEAGSLGSGSPVYFRGVAVGQIEAISFDADSGRVSFDTFVKDPYDKLVTSSSKFWNISGFKVDLSSEGFEVQIGSVESLLAGGVAFDYPNKERIGENISDGHEYILYEDLEKSEAPKLDLTLSYQLFFDDSVRGLKIGAPVEYRGIRVGTVTDISLVGAPYQMESRIPVMIQLAPNRLVEVDGDLNIAAMDFLSANIQEGLRASLKTGNIITGQLFVDLDFEEDPSPMPLILSDIGPKPSLPTIPTVSAGITRIEDKLIAILEKMDGLKIQEVLEQGTQTMAAFSDTAQDSKDLIADLRDTTLRLNKMLEAPEIHSLPENIQLSLKSFQSTIESYGQNSNFQGDLTRTLEELRYSIRSINRLAETVERRPNSLIFGRKKGKPSAPRAKP